MDNESKNFIPEEESDSFFTDDIVKGLLIVALVFVVFVIGFNIFSPDDSAGKVPVSSSSAVTVAQTTQAPTAAPATQAPTVAPSVEQPAVTTTAANVAPEAQGKTTAEIITLFNESANKVKTEAVKVVKNFENRTHNEEHLILPSLVEGMAKDLMEKNFADDTEPIEYPTREEIIAGYPVPGESWSSQLTEAEVAEASCIDNGTEYEITLKLHPTLNPEPGIGTAKAFDCITTSEVTESAPAMIETFTTEYYDCVVKCKIDKATGRTVWSNYTSPVIINVVVNMGFTKVEARVGLTFEKDYTITY